MDKCVSGASEPYQFLDPEVEQRCRLFRIDSADIRLITSISPQIEAASDLIVERFYEQQTQVPELSGLFGNPANRRRLHKLLRGYILEMFNGRYDRAYFISRLNLGLTHKRLGVDSTLFLCSMQQLKALVCECLQQLLHDRERCISTLSALDKVFALDLSLVFDTYIQNLLAEIQSARQRVEQFELDLEDQIRARTRELEILARTDPLTGLQSVRYLHETLSMYLSGAQRRRETLCVVYMDINDFKAFNDSEGHHRGDQVLCCVADAIRRVSREVDGCFRYGGDEFCVILPDCTAEQARNIYSQRLSQAIHEAGERIAFSVGIVEAGPGDYRSAEALIRLADRAMYQQKARYKRDSGGPAPRGAGSDQEQ